MEIIDRVSSRSIELKTSTDIYHIQLLPTDLFQIVKVNTLMGICHSAIFGFIQFDNNIRGQFKSCEELFSSVRNAKSRSLQAVNQNPFVVRITFQIKNKLHSFDFQLRETKKQQMECEDVENLREKINTIKAQNIKLIKQNQSKDEKISQLEISIIAMKRQYDQVCLKLKRIELQFKERSYHDRKNQSFEGLIPHKVSNHVPLVSLDYNKQIQQGLKSKKIEFSPFENNYIKNFIVNANLIRLQIEHKDFYQISSQNSIETSTKTHLGITMIKSKRKDIYFGVMKQNRRKQKFTCQHKESISYKLSGGKMLFEDGTQSGEKVPQINQGQTLNLSIDGPNKEVTWYIEDKFMLKRRIPASMENSPLFAFVSLHDKDDQVELI